VRFSSEAEPVIVSQRGREHRSEREEWSVVDSPRDVPTYDKKPAMSAPEAAEAFISSWNENPPRFGIINFANADMVGHSGVIPAVVEAVAPKPVNVLVGSDFTTVAELAEAGVRRISVGGALARAAWGGFLQAAREIAEKGTFGGLARAVPFADINGAFAP